MFNKWCNINIIYKLKIAKILSYKKLSLTTFIILYNSQILYYKYSTIKVTT